MKSSSIFELQVVGIHFSQKISFTAIGAQAKTDSLSVSIFSQFSFTKLYDCTFGSYFCILSKKYLKTSSLVVSFDFIFEIISSKLKSLKFIKFSLVYKITLLLYKNFLKSQKKS